MENNVLEDTNTPGHFVRDAIRSTPVMQVLAGIQGPLDILSEGFSRYEAAKTGFVENVVLGKDVKKNPLDAAKGIGDIVSGKAKSKFTKETSKLKHTDMPEMGDIFREAGLPETVAATLGVAADVATDLIWGPVTAAIKGTKAATEAVKGVGALLKPAKQVAKAVDSRIGSIASGFLESKGVQEFFKPVDQAATKLGDKLTSEIPKTVESLKGSAGEWMDTFGKEYSQFMHDSGATARIKSTAELIKNKVSDAIPEATKSWYMGSRTKVLVDDTIDMLKGKTSLSNLPPEFVDAINIKDGKINVDGANASVLARQIKGLSKDSLDSKMIDRALKGDVPIESLKPEAQQVVRDVRNIIKANGQRIAASLDDIAEDDLLRIAESQDIDPNGPEAILELKNRVLNQGEDYQTRSHKVFTKGAGWKSDEALKAKAAQQFVDGGWAKNTDEAINIMNQFEQGGANGWKNVRKVNSSNFKGLKELPEAFREWLGEIDDPAFNTIKTIQIQSEIANTMGVFKAGKEMGLFSNVPSAIHTHPVPKGGPLSWGVAHGTYTTPEIAEYLAFQQKWKDQMDTGLLHWLKFIKTSKTMFSPKAWGHSIFGNTMFFGPLAGVTPMTHAEDFKGAWDVLSDAEKVLSGKLSKEGSKWHRYERALRNNIVGNEIANRDELVGLASHIGKPWEQATSLQDIKSFDDFVKFTGKAYSNQDAIYKLAAFENYIEKRGMSEADAAKEVYKWFPDPKNASKFAQEARNTGFGTFFLNPFTTFQSEAHRIMLNAWNESPKSRFILASMMGSRMAFNAAVLAYAGHSVQDMISLARTRPEVASEVLFNPSNPNFDLNVKYIDPFNTSGLFAPLMFLAGGTNTNPFDYLLDFTQFSPEFGYSNFLVNAIEPLVTGKGKYGEDLSLSQRLTGVLDSHLSTSFTKDLPKALNVDGTVDPAEQQRRALRFFGFDAEARNADYIKRDVQKELTKAVEEGKDLTSMTRVLDFMGFDAEAMVKATKVRVENKRIAEKKKSLLGL